MVVSRIMTHSVQTCLAAESNVFPSQRETVQVATIHSGSWKPHYPKKEEVGGQGDFRTRGLLRK